MRLIAATIALALLAGHAHANAPKAAPPSGGEAAEAIRKFYEERGLEPPGPKAPEARQPGGQDAGKPPGGGCAGTGDLAQLLSPECLDSLKALRVPGGGAALPPGPSAGPASAGPVQCSVAIFGGSFANGGFSAQSGSTASFPSASLERCIEAGARLSFGIVGLSNIVATDPGLGVVGVSCRREGPDGRRITCQAQPNAQGGAQARRR